MADQQLVPYDFRAPPPLPPLPPGGHPEISYVPPKRRAPEEPIEGTYEARVEGRAGPKITYQRTGELSTETEQRLASMSALSRAIIDSANANPSAEQLAATPQGQVAALAASLGPQGIRDLEIEAARQRADIARQTVNEMELSNTVAQLDQRAMELERPAMRATITPAQAPKKIVLEPDTPMRPARYGTLGLPSQMADQPTRIGQYGKPGDPSSLLPPPMSALRRPFPRLNVVPVEQVAAPQQGVEPPAEANTPIGSIVLPRLGKKKIRVQTLPAAVPIATLTPNMPATSLPTPCMKSLSTIPTDHASLAFAPMASSSTALSVANPNATIIEVPAPPAVCKNELSVDLSLPGYTDLHKCAIAMISRILPTLSQSSMDKVCKKWWQITHTKKSKGEKSKTPSLKNLEKCALLAEQESALNLRSAFTRKLRAMKKQRKELTSHSSGAYTAKQAAKITTPGVSAGDTIRRKGWQRRDVGYAKRLAAARGLANASLISARRWARLPKYMRGFDTNLTARNGILGTIPKTGDAARDTDMG